MGLGSDDPSSVAFTTHLSNSGGSILLSPSQRAPTRLPPSSSFTTRRGSGESIRKLLSQGDFRAYTPVRKRVGTPCVLESSGAVVCGTHREYEWLTDQPGSNDLSASSCSSSWTSSDSVGHSSPLGSGNCSEASRCFPDRIRMATVLPLRMVWDHRQANSSGLSQKLL